MQYTVMGVAVDLVFGLTFALLIVNIAGGLWFSVTCWTLSAGCLVCLVIWGLFGS